MAVLQEWTSAPRHPKLGDGEVSVWRLASSDLRPLETVLARHLDIEPGALTIERTSTGKPELAGSRLRASLAHSGEVALVAVTDGRDVGVDVERVREGAELRSLVNHALTANERRQFEQVPEVRRADTFLSIWARKEALLKAAGVGLSVDPALVELDGSAILAVPSELGSTREWNILDILLPGHLAAVAVRGGVSKLHLYDAR